MLSNNFFLQVFFFKYGENFIRNLYTYKYIIQNIMYRKESPPMHDDHEYNNKQHRISVNFIVEFIYQSIIKKIYLHKL